jgi:hypothetical protein
MMTVVEVVEVVEVMPVVVVVVVGDGVAFVAHEMVAKKISCKIMELFKCTQTTYGCPTVMLSGNPQ